MNTNKQAQGVLVSLAFLASDRDIQLDAQTQELMLDSIELKLERGWTSLEIVQHMRNMEEISPHLSEEEALDCMRAVQSRVSARLARAA